MVNLFQDNTWVCGKGVCMCMIIRLFHVWYPQVSSIFKGPAGTTDSLCIDNGNLHACITSLSFHPGHPSIRRHSDRSQNSQYGSGKKEREPERIRKDADHALPMPRNWDCEDDRRCQKKDAREDSILYYGIGSIKQGWPIGHPLLLPQDYVVDVYLLVRLEAGSLH